jgi:hypothetical protein
MESVTMQILEDDVSEERLPYLVWRCYGCGRLITRLEIYARWKKSEGDNYSDNSTCPCGSGKIAPSNPKLWEEVLLPRIWKLWWVDVFLPWLRSKR